MTTWRVKIVPAIVLYVLIAVFTCAYHFRRHEQQDWGAGNPLRYMSAVVAGVMWPLYIPGRIAYSVFDDIERLEDR